MADRRRSPRLLDENTSVVRAFTLTTDAAVGQELDAATSEMEQARQRGYQEGVAKAEAELTERRESFRSEAAATLNRLAQLEQSLTRQHEGKLLEIAMEAASRIVRERLEADDPVAARALKEAMQSLPSGTNMKVLINPEELESVAELVSAEVETGRLELISDPGISPGGVVVESGVGSVDATIETAEESAHRAATGGGED